MRQHKVTEILRAVGTGDETAEETLIPLVYDELKRIAQAKMARERPGLTLQSTALVHEAYLRLVRAESPDWQSRTHFFSAAAEAMRRILIDRYRRSRRQRHGGDRQRIPLDEVEVPIVLPSVDVEALSEALDELEKKDPRATQVIKLRFFIGLDIEETAEVLGIAPRTARADWTVAKAWLRSRLADGGAPEGDAG